MNVQIKKQLKKIPYRFNERSSNVFFAFNLKAKRQPLKIELPLLFIVNDFVLKSSNF